MGTNNVVGQILDNHILRLKEMSIALITGSNCQIIGAEETTTNGDNDTLIKAGRLPGISSIAGTDDRTW